MAEKTFRSRIVNRHDTEANWLKATNFYPLEGEIIIYDADDTHSYERMKIGDGKTLVSDLPFADDNKVDKEPGKGLSTNDYTNEDKSKLSGIAAGAEVNQNAFSNVKVGSTTVAADAKTDTLTIEAGENVQIVADATNDKVTISATDTVYTHPTYTVWTGVPTANQTPAFGGTFNITQPVSDDTGHITAMNSRTVTIPNTAATTSAAGLMSAGDKTKLDGIAEGANNYTLPAATASALGGVKIGSNITNDAGTISLTHDNVVSALGFTPGNSDGYEVATETTDGLMSKEDRVTMNNVVTVDPNDTAIQGSAVLVNAGTFDGKTYAQVKADVNASAPVQSVNGKTGVLTLSASDVGAATSGHTHTILADGSGNQILYCYLPGAEDRVAFRTTSRNGDYSCVNFGDNTFYTGEGYRVYAENYKPSYSDVGAAAASHTHNYAGSNGSGGGAIKNYVPRETIDANTFNTSAASLLINEAANSSTNIPDANWYFINSYRGSDDNYESQVAVGMTKNAMYHRQKMGGTWNSWTKLIDSTCFSLSGTTLTITTT